MKSLMKLSLMTLGIGLSFGSGLFFTLRSSHAIRFESLESKTETGASVFNQILFKSGLDQDVWIMRQSHHGNAGTLENWDRLAIVVDKTTTPKKAHFFQLKSGELTVSSEVEPYKARCYACHANGPRAIRPQYKSLAAPVSLIEKLQVAAWNLRIKTYGHVESLAGQAIKEGAPFKATHAILSRPLALQSCTRCHSDQGVRNELKLEHLGTARFLVSKGLMPPFPFQISEKDRKALN